MGVMGCAGFRSLGGVQRELETIFSVQMPSIDFLIGADRDLQQLLVVERSMIFTDPNTTMFEPFIKEYETNSNQSDTRWNKYKALATTAAGKNLFGVYDKARNAWQIDSRQVVDLARKATEEASRQATALTLGSAKKHFEQMPDQLDKLTEINLDLVQRASESAAATHRSATTVLLPAIVLGISAGLVPAWFISRAITRPVNAMVDGLKDIAQVSSGVQEVNENVNQSSRGAAQISRDISTVNPSAGEMAGGSGQVRVSAEDLRRIARTLNSVVGSFRV